MADIIVFEVHAGNVARALNFMWNLGLLQNMLLVNSTYCFSGRNHKFSRFLPLFELLKRASKPHFVAGPKGFPKRG